VGHLFPRVVLIGACLALAAVLGTTLGLAQQVSRASQEAIAVGVDADPTGNSATSLGEIDACASAETGQTFDVDIFVSDVVDINCWQATLTYDPSVVDVVDADAELLLASQEGSNLIDLSGPLEAQDAYLLIVADMQAASESGSGILARVTLEALGPGSTALALYDVIICDPESTPLGDADGDSYFDGPIAFAQVWVDEPCPSALPTLTPVPPPTIAQQATPVPPASPFPPPATATPGGPAADGEPTEGEDDDGFPWAVAVGVSAGAVVAALAAGLAVRWLQRRPG
jgi:hypothetical protein